MVSLAMSKIGSHQPIRDKHSAQRVQISMVDIKRAYFYATIDPSEPPTFVQLPEEDPDHETMTGQLLRHMYGTRAAADGWQEEYSTFLVSIGFRPGSASANVFHHISRGITTSVHGDDLRPRRCLRLAR